MSNNNNDQNVPVDPATLLRQGQVATQQPVITRDFALEVNPGTTPATSFDLAKFIRELPRVEERDFPKEPEDVCSICRIKHGSEDPDTGYTEQPVRLPCNHIVGKACILKWLTRGPEGGNANSCPICRRKFFEPWPQLPQPPTPTPVRGRGRGAPGPAGLATGQRRPHQTLSAAQQSLRRVEASADATLRSGNRPRTRPLARASGTPRPTRDLNLPTPIAATQPRNEQPPRPQLPPLPVPRLSQRHSFEYVVHAMENAGFYVSPYLGQFRTDQERDQARREHAANRRSVAIPERDLFNWVVRQDIGLLAIPILPENTAWIGSGPLDAAQDLQLFEWLQDHYSFQGLKLNEDYRKEGGGPRTGRVREDNELWEVLRAKGYYWDVHNERNGRWRNRAGPLYTDQEEDESDNFQELAMQGAFATVGIRRAFPNVDDYTIFRNLRVLEVRWDYHRRIWYRGDNSALYDDGVRSPQEQGQAPALIPMRLARRLGARVIRGESRAFAQQANSVTAAALGRLLPEA